MITYQSLYDLIRREIAKRQEFAKYDQYGNQLSRSQLTSPVGLTAGNLSLTVRDLTNTINDILADLVPPYIKTGLNVSARTPISTTINITQGEGVAGGKLHRLNVNKTLKVVFDSVTSVYYINLYADGLTIDKSTDIKKLTIAKIVVPKPGTTSLIQDDKDKSWNAYIVNLKEYRLYGDAEGNLEEDSIDFLRDNISPILADNIIGNIRLNEDLKIINTAGTLELNSDSLILKDISGDTLAKFNRRGTFFYDTNGIEMARFTSADARIGNILITKNSVESTNFASGFLGSGFQIRDNGDAEFQNILARGRLTCSVFVKDTISVVGGSVLVMDGDVLDDDMTAED